MSEKEWYIVQFKPNCQNIAKKNIERQGFEVFLPLHNVTTRAPIRFVNRLRPIFPGYMFVLFDKSDLSWIKINNTMGVSRLVKIREKPSAVPRNLITSLMERSNSDGVLYPDKTLKNGDRVEILKGPFVNFVATIEEIEAEKRIWLLMEFMGQQSKIEVKKNNLRPVN